MIFDGCHFEYGNFISRKHDLVFAHLDTSADTRVSGEINSQYIFNKKNLSRYYIGTDYSDAPVSFEVEIVTTEARPIGVSEWRSIEKALFNRAGYRRLYIDMADDYYCRTYEFIDGIRKRLYLMCRFVNPSTIEGGDGQPIGFRCTMECSSLMFNQDVISKSFELSGGSVDTAANFTINIDTDIDEYTYPNITIQVGSSGGDIIICNNTDDSTRLTKFVDIAPLSLITMRGETNYLDVIYYEKFSGRNFIRLLDGDNTFTVVGDVQLITFEYSQRRFL